VLKEAKLLLELLSKGLKLEEAAESLGITTTRARLLVAYLASKGMLRQAPAGCGCNTCPFKRSCSLSRRAIIYIARQDN